MQLKNIKGVGDKTLFKLRKLGIENIDKIKSETEKLKNFSQELDNAL